MRKRKHSAEVDASIETTVRKLRLVSSVISTRWTHVRLIVEMINSVKVISKKWCGYESAFKNENSEYFPLHLERMDTWSTYDGCSDLKFSVSENGEHLICDAVIWNGETLYGRRESERFQAKLELPIEFITRLAGLIDEKFACFLEDQYTEFLETQKENWMRDLSIRLLQSPKDLKRLKRNIL